MNLFREEAALKKQKKTIDVCSAREKPWQSVIFGGNTVLWQGRNRLTVEGADKIGYLSPERIVVLLGKDSLSVCGKKLMCLSFRDDVLVIGGRIDSLDYGEGCV